MKREEQISPALCAELQSLAERKVLESVRDVLIICCFSGHRYSDVFNFKKFKDGKVLPVICNQRIDEAKYEWDFVGIHIGRKTFIVNALSFGVPPDVVMKKTISI